MLRLTEREQQVLSLYLRLGRIESVAETLQVSVHTVRRQRENIMKKLCVRNTVELTLAAVQRGLYDAKS